MAERTKRVKKRTGPKIGVLFNGPNQLFPFITIKPIRKIYKVNKTLCKKEIQVVDFLFNLSNIY